MMGVRDPRTLAAIMGTSAALGTWEALRNENRRKEFPLSQRDRPNPLKGAAVGALAGLGLGLVRGDSARQAAARAMIGGSLLAGTTFMTQKQYDSTPTFYKNAGELEKEAGNRLARHIADNRDDYPMSRLQQLRDQGYVRSPGTYAEGLHVGNGIREQKLAYRHGWTIEHLKPGEFDMDPLMYFPGGKRALKIRSEYSQRLGYSSGVAPLSDGTTTAKVVVPPSRGASGDLEEDLRRMMDSHTRRHEMFEIDEAARNFRRGGVNAAHSRVYTHISPAVLARESLDMGHNPYAHVQPSVVVGGVRKAISRSFNEAKDGGSQGVSLFSGGSASRPATDPTSALGNVRRVSGEKDFIEKGLGMGTYMGAPNSRSAALVRKARALSPDAARRLEEAAAPRGWGKARALLSTVVNSNIGSKAWRK